MAVWMRSVPPIRPTATMVGRQTAATFTVAGDVVELNIEPDHPSDDPAGPSDRPPSRPWALGPSVTSCTPGSEATPPPTASVRAGQATSVPPTASGPTVTDCTTVVGGPYTPWSVHSTAIQLLASLFEGFASVTDQADGPP